MKERSTPEIRPIPARDFDASVLPPDARIPGTGALEVAAVTVDDDFIPQTCPGTRLEREYQMALSIGGSRP